MIDFQTVLAEMRTHIPEGEIALRLTLATMFGAIIGFEREIKDHAAGLRTHMLTALAAALFTVLTFEIFYEIQSRSTQNNADPIRIVEAVTAGVAFLAAGAIISRGGQVRGLTTGAGMWLAGAIGLACGAGRYLIAFMAVILALIILSMMKRLENRIIGNDRDSDG
jgi:putative Mg2+ transporter-C (MgtC) family protein